MAQQPLDLDAIEARTNNATPAPWGYYDGGDYADLVAGYQPTGPGSYTCTQSIARIEADEYEAEDDDEAADQMRADAEFITHARTDVPALVAEIRRLTAELATMTAVAESNKRYVQSMYQDLQQAQQQTEAARCRLHHIQARLERLDISDDPTGVAGDIGPWIDGPLHPDELADYRASTNPAAPSGA